MRATWGAPARLCQCIERTQRRAALQARRHAIAVRRNTPAGRREAYDHPQLIRNPKLEVLLLLWDEMDDWLGAARHMLRRLA
jgi:hypothetical protein